MPPTISWSDLAGRRVGVWGLGVEGSANLRKLDELGIPAAVRVDDRPGEGVVPTAEGGLEALGGCDVVVKSPGISRYRDDLRSLEAAGVPVVGGLGLWLAGADRDRVVCVTGTKGKSTTTSVAGHLGAGLGQRVLMCGNLGVAPWDPEAPQDVDWWVVETSSYQATDVVLGPAVVAVTSLSQDHLDWHGGPEHYYRDKLSLCRRPGVRRVVADGDSPLLREHTDLLGPGVRWVHATDDPGWTGGLGLLGEHNVRNALVARAALVELGVPGADDDARIAAAAGDFAGLGSRLRPVGRVDGVDFVDDSLSTNVLPTLAAVDAFRGRRVALLVGGHDRGIDYAPLADGLTGRADLLVVCLPDSGPRIAEALRAGAPDLDVREVPALFDGVHAAFEWARPDGVVLLSPAAPSFGQYRNYEDRAADFVRSMESVSER